jgi:hypothetical protein
LNNKEINKDDRLLKLVLRNIFYRLDSDLKPAIMERNYTMPTVAKWLEGIIDDRYVSWYRFLKRIRFDDSSQMELAKKLGLSMNDQIAINAMMVEGMIRTGILVARDKLEGKAYSIFSSMRDEGRSCCLYHHNTELMLVSETDAQAFAAAYERSTGLEIQIEGVTIEKVERKMKGKGNLVKGDDWPSRLLGEDLENILEIFSGRSGPSKMPFSDIPVDFASISKELKSILRVYGIYEKQKSNISELDLRSLQGNPDLYLRNLLSSEVNEPGLFQSVPAFIKKDAEKIAESRGRFILLTKTGSIGIERKTINIFEVAEAIEKKIQQRGIIGRVAPFELPANRCEANKSAAIMVYYRLKQHNKGVGDKVRAQKQMLKDPPVLYSRRRKRVPLKTEKDKP